MSAVKELSNSELNTSANKGNTPVIYQQRLEQLESSSESDTFNYTSPEDVKVKVLELQLQQTKQRYENAQQSVNELISKIK